MTAPATHNTCQPWRSVPLRDRLTGREVCFKSASLLEGSDGLLGRDEEYAFDLFGKLGALPSHVQHFNELIDGVVLRPDHMEEQTFPLTEQIVVVFCGHPDAPSRTTPQRSEPSRLTQRKSA